MRQLHCNHACHSGFYTLVTRCHTCIAVTLKYTEASSLTVLWHSLFDLPIYVLRMRKLWFWYCIKFNKLKAHSHWPSPTQSPMLTPLNYVASESRSVWALRYSFIKAIYLSVSVSDLVSVSVSTPLHQGVKNHFGSSFAWISPRVKLSISSHVTEIPKTVGKKLTLNQ